MCDDNQVNNATAILTALFACVCVWVCVSERVYAADGGVNSFKPMRATSGLIRVSVVLRLYQRTILFVTY